METNEASSELVVQGRDGAWHAYRLVRTHHGVSVERVYDATPVGMGEVMRELGLDGARALLAEAREMASGAR